MEFGIRTVTLNTSLCPLIIHPVVCTYTCTYCIRLGPKSYCLTCPGIETLADVLFLNCPLRMLQVMEDTYSKCTDIDTRTDTQLTHERGYGIHTSTLHCYMYLHSMACSRELKD